MRTSYIISDKITTITMTSFGVKLDNFNNEFSGFNFIFYPDQILRESNDLSDKNLIREPIDLPEESLINEPFDLSDKDLIKEPIDLPDE